MFFKRFYHEGLAQASYLIGCESTGEAIVVDANRDVEMYVAAAAEEELRITHVTETHIHADFVSGSRELASRTGAALLLSAEGGTDWQYGFAESDRATLLRNGDSIAVGRVRLDVLHTPGHTPEHLALLVSDLATSDLPVGLLSGDFVFVGDVGRPDLLERAAGVSGTKEAAAHTLFRSLARFRALPDFVQVWPGHGAGSACGKALGAMPMSTVGYEKVANWGVTAREEQVFVDGVLEGQPDPPPYFAVMKKINRDGPRLLGERAGPVKLESAGFERRMAAGALAVDVRPTERFAQSHIPGTLNIPLGRSLSNWAGWLVPYDRDVVLVAERHERALDATREMSLIGLDRVVGWFDEEVLGDWERAGRSLERVGQSTPAELATELARTDVTVLDVRNEGEWEAGHIDGALHIPLGVLQSRIAEVPREGPIVVQCQGGTRSAIAASVLLANGLRDVRNLQGGFREWSRTPR